MNTPITQICADPQSRSRSRRIPPLENGDRLSREEFERRYEAMPQLRKAELIEGVVFMSSPVSVEDHGTPHAALMMPLSLYWTFTPGVCAGDNSTLRLDPDNEVQPDGFLFIEPECGGRVKREGGYIVGGPELAGEIAASSASHDIGPKLNVYRRNGVREYVVWRVFDEAIDWFILRGSQYERLTAADGIYRSKVFPGLWLDAAALLRGDLVRVHDVLQQGLASTEHQDFVAKLRAHGLAKETALPTLEPR